ncbi:hypothetical protein PR048_017176 [Dryococelus australis]|uniref:Uncharacterized protein n=1 Tax=Dryococelus australis TaxID=614101 RepID=A0ABQ9H8W9_9NEOP|nr:hypothetical protein PR048_017176 [Dryococelus australis]
MKDETGTLRENLRITVLSVNDLICAVQRYDGNTARIARRSDEILRVHVSVARIAPSLLDLGRADGRICCFSRGIEKPAQPPLVSFPSALKGFQKNYSTPNILGFTAPRLADHKATSTEKEGAKASAAAIQCLARRQYYIHIFTYAMLRSLAGSIGIAYASGAVFTVAELFVCFLHKNGKYNEGAVEAAAVTVDIRSLSSESTATSQFVVSASTFSIVNASIALHRRHRRCAGVFQNKILCGDAWKVLCKGNEKVVADSLSHMFYDEEFNIVQTESSCIVVETGSGNGIQNKEQGEARKARNDMYSTTMCAVDTARKSVASTVLGTVSLQLKLYVHSHENGGSWEAEARVGHQAVWQASRTVTVLFDDVWLNLIRHLWSIMMEHHHISVGTNSLAYTFLLLYESSGLFTPGNVSRPSSTQRLLLTLQYFASVWNKVASPWHTCSVTTYQVVTDATSFTVNRVLLKSTFQTCHRCYLHNPWPGRSQVFTSGNRGGRCHLSTSFPEDLLFPPPLHSSAASFSPHFTLIDSQDLDPTNYFLRPLGIEGVGGCLRPPLSSPRRPHNLPGVVGENGRLTRAKMSWNAVSGISLETRYIEFLRQDLLTGWLTDKRANKVGPGPLVKFLHLQRCTGRYCGAISDVRIAEASWWCVDNHAKKKTGSITAGGRSSVLRSAPVEVYAGMGSDFFWVDFKSAHFIVNSLHIVNIQSIPPNVNSPKISGTIAEHEMRFSLNEITYGGKQLPQSDYSCKQATRAVTRIAWPIGRLHGCDRLWRRGGVEEGRENWRNPRKRLNFERVPITLAAAEFKLGTADE